MLKARNSKATKGDMCLVTQSRPSAESLVLTAVLCNAEQAGFSSIVAQQVEYAKSVTIAISTGHYNMGDTDSSVVQCRRQQ